LAGVAKAFADDSRAAMMVALMNGREWTAGELAMVAGVAQHGTRRASTSNGSLVPV
jgi:hypothetical protein